MDRSTVKTVRPIGPKDAAPSVIFWTATLAVVVAASARVPKEIDVFIAASARESWAQDRVDSSASVVNEIVS